LSYTCRAYRDGRIDEFPPRRSAGPLPLRTGSLLLLLPDTIPSQLRRELKTGFASGRQVEPDQGFPAALRQHPLLLVRRAERGLLGGLWELPNYPERGSELAERLVEKSIQILLYTGQEVRHRYSHFEVRFEMLVAVFAGNETLDSWAEQRWVLPMELASYPRPKVHIEAMRRFGLLEG
jgi:adenine-specific DNA glycosylase